MLRLLVPVVLIAAGAAGGAFVGLQSAAQKPSEGEATDAAKSTEAEKTQSEDEGKEPEGADETAEFVKLSNQFVVPILSEGRHTALIVISLSVETDVGGREVVYAREPRLRDALLQTLFDHANFGGFSDNYTSGVRLDALRRKLTDRSREIVGETVRRVHITQIAKQEA